MSSETAAEASVLSYAYRPSLLGAPWEFRLGEREMEWSAGRYSGRVPYGKIHRVRLSFKPNNLQQRRFMTELWADGLPVLKIVSSSWKSMFEQERFDAAYAEFVGALHRRMIDAGTTAEFQQGSNPLLYWPGFALFTAVTLGMAWLVLRAMQEAAFSGALFIAAFIALFVWRGWNFFNRNRPGIYRPDLLPARLLPAQ